MRHGLPRRLIVLLMPALALWTASAAEPDDPVLLLQSSSGSHTVTGENVLIVQEIVGTLSLRAAGDDVLHFEGRSLGSDRAQQDVALWRSGDDTLLLGPGADVAKEGILVDMVVPDSLDLEVILVGGRVLVSGILGDLLVEAENARVQARGLRGDGEFLLQGGQLAVDGVKGTFDFKGTEVDAKIQHLYDEAFLELKQGRTNIAGADGDVQIESDQTDLELSRIAGMIHVEGNGGTLRVTKSEGGGEFHFEQLPFGLVQSKGDYSVETDALVEIEQHEGSLRVLGFGAPVRASQVAGTLTVENSSSSVEAKVISGNTEITGSDLKVQVDDCKGVLTVRTISSEVAINGSKNAVVVENEYGDVRVSKTEASLTINARGGNVHVTDHQGRLEVRADGPEVRVGWAKFTRNEPVTVQNETGDVHLALPAGGRCRLQLRAPFGRVDAEGTGIRVADDGHSADGEFTGGKGRAPQLKKPAITATSGGSNVYVTTGNAEK